MKLFAASENKLKRVMAVAKNGMESTGLKWNEKECAVIQVKRGQVEQGSEDMKIAELKPIKSLDQHNTYKFLGVFENTKEEDKQVLEAAAKAYLQRLSIVWSSPLSINDIRGEMARKAYQEQMGRQESKTGGVLCVAFFMEECPNAYHRWSTRAVPTAVTYQGSLQQKNKITSY